MKKPEEIKKGLENCTRLGGCVSCPYFVDNTMAQCTPVMATDALAYIRQLEAKLAEYDKPLVPLTFDDIASTIFCTPCWVETMTSMWPDVLDKDSVGFVGKLDNRGRRTTRYLMEAEYGKTWRCWSRRPTDEEIKAVKWDD